MSQIEENMMKISPFLCSVRFFCSPSIPKSISFNKISELVDQWDCVQTSFRSRGYVLLQAPDASTTTLEKVANLFGIIQRHVRSPETGITEIVGRSSRSKKNQVASNEEFFPHTDGTFLNGIIFSKEGKYVRVGPPKLILLQCVQPSSDGGGTNILVDGQKILNEIVEKDPELLPIIFSPVSIIRGGYFVLDTPIFKQLSNGLYMLRFSYDSDLYFPKKMKEPFAYFNKHYVLNDQNRKLEHLNKGEILVVDNLRTLHARTAFLGERYFRRVWIHHDLETEEFTRPEEKIYYKSDFSMHSLVTQYESYGPVSNHVSQDESIQTGIKILPHLENVIENLGFSKKN